VPASFRGAPAFSKEQIIRGAVMNSNEAKLDARLIPAKLAVSVILTVVLTWTIYSMCGRQSHFTDEVGRSDSVLTAAETQPGATLAPAEARTELTPDSTQQYSMLPEVVVVARRIVDAGR
jgi:hypothetical protein